MLAPLAIGGHRQLVGRRPARSRSGRRASSRGRVGSTPSAMPTTTTSVEVEAEGQRQRADQHAVAEAAPATEVGVELEGEGPREAVEVWPPAPPASRSAEPVEGGLHLVGRLPLGRGPRAPGLRRRRGGRRGGGATSSASAGPRRCAAPAPASRSSRPSTKSRSARACSASRRSRRASASRSSAGRASASSCLAVGEAGEPVVPVGRVGADHAGLPREALPGDRRHGPPPGRRTGAPARTPNTSWRRGGRSARPRSPSRVRPATASARRSGAAPFHGSSAASRWWWTSAA